MLSLFFAVAVLSADPWDSLDQILIQGIQDQVYPGCVALVGNKDQTFYAKAFGSYTYGIPPPYAPSGVPPGTNPPMSLNTRFEMASCTKVVATTTVVAQLYDMGILSLNTKIADILPGYANNGKNNITVMNCMLHNSGYPPDPVPSWNSVEFGCPETSQPFPQENFSCRQQIYNALLVQTLQNPVGTTYVYSDLSMITLMFATGTILRAKGLVSESDLRSDCMAAGTGPDAAACYYEAWLRKQVWEPLSMNSTGLLLDQSVWGECAPEQNDTTYTNKVIQGQVSDGNGYAIGGIAGHAGLFTTAPDLARFVRSLMYKHDLISNSTYQYFIKEYNQTQSSRAIGWNTNDPDSEDQGWSLSCGETMTPLAFMHIGYTGTMICGSPTGQYFTILLSNRIYPNDANGSTGIHNVQQAFGDAVVAILGP